MLDSCGGGSRNAWTVRVTLPEVDDDVGVASLRLERVEESGGRATVRAVLIGGSDELTVVETRAGRHRDQVVAFDLAGNEVESEPFEVVLSGFGCSATHGAGGSAPLALAFLVVPMTFFLRRPRARC